MENIRFDFVGLWSTAGRQQKLFLCSREWAGGSIPVALAVFTAECCVTVQLPIDLLESLINHLLD